MATQLLQIVPYYKRLSRSRMKESQQSKIHITCSTFCHEAASRKTEIKGKVGSGKVTSVTDCGRKHIPRMDRRYIQKGGSLSALSSFTMLFMRFRRCATALRPLFHADPASWTPLRRRPPDFVVNQILGQIVDQYCQHRRAVALYS